MTGRVPAWRATHVGRRSHLRANDDGAAHRALALLDGSPFTPQPDPWGWVPAWLRARLPFVPAPPPPAQIVPGPSGATVVSVVDTAGL